MIVRLNKAILHVLDLDSAVNVYSKAELDLEEKPVKSYVSSICKKALGSTDCRHGKFASDSALSTKVSRYFHDAEDSFSREGLAEQVFADSEPCRKAFETAADVRHLPERVAVDKRAVAQKRVRCHRIVTDTGIEVSFPAEYGENPEFIEFSTGENGLINIELRNIGSIENK